MFCGKKKKKLNLNQAQTEMENTFLQSLRYFSFQNVSVFCQILPEPSLTGLKQSWRCCTLWFSVIRTHAFKLWKPNKGIIVLLKVHRRNGRFNAQSDDTKQNFVYTCMWNLIILWSCHMPLNYCFVFLHNYWSIHLRLNIETLCCSRVRVSHTHHSVNTTWCKSPQWLQPPHVNDGEETFITTPREEVSRCERPQCFLVI